MCDGKEPYTLPVVDPCFTKWIHRLQLRVLFPSSPLPPPPPPHPPTLFFSAFPCSLLPLSYRLVGFQGVHLERRAEDPGFDSPLLRGYLSGSSHTSDLKLALQWLPSQATIGIGSALRLVGPMSVYCDWERQKFSSATSI